MCQCKKQGAPEGNTNAAKEVKAKRVNLRLYPQHKQMLEEIAAKLDLDQSKAARQAIEDLHAKLFDF